MIKELNEASKKIYDICKQAEDEMWSFERLLSILMRSAFFHVNDVTINYVIEFDIKAYV